MIRRLIILLLIVGCGTEPEDCAGVLGGIAEIDDCGGCIGGDTGKEACEGELPSEIWELTNLTH